MKSQDLISEHPGLSPMMQQYFSIKQTHKDHILFFRLGDFYEMFFEDAVLASKELDLVLTGRDCGLEERAPMCGVPYHACDTYIARLIKKGYKVAICEQMENPALAKGLVKREVIRVITPGTLIEANMLDEERNNYIASVYLGGERCGLCFADISTGNVNITEINPADESRIKNELGKFSPSEIIYNRDTLLLPGIGSFMSDKLHCTSQQTDETLSYEDSVDSICSYFSADNIAELRLTELPNSVMALASLLLYLNENQKLSVKRLSKEFSIYDQDKYMSLDMTAIRNLELFQTMRSGEKKGSLLWVIDKTCTAMGKRLIRSYLDQPLLNPAAISKRQNAVSELLDNSKRERIRSALSGLYDLERLMTRILYSTATPREMKSLEQTAEKLPQIHDLLEGFTCFELNDIKNRIDLLEDIAEAISLTIIDNPPLLKDGGVIKPGANSRLDHLRELKDNSSSVLAQIENREKEKTGIKTLKIGYNRVFGYYIDVSKSYIDLVPKEYIRKQTLANNERYITQELKELEESILSANNEIAAIEADIFEKLRAAVASQLHRVQSTASAIARLDVYCSFAHIAVENGYCCPDVDFSDVIDIKEGRHPVIELLSSAPFVCNDTYLDCKENQISIITGPNMAGKSTYMRQTALIVLMAQIGSFVPAKSARIGIVDGIYTRVGAADDLAAGQSTFMVEMTEVAEIIKNATSKSLLILDEIGRGTSTYDGMSIAHAIIEYIADKKSLGAKTLFATHYHELTALENQIKGVKNYNIAVKKRGTDIIFLRRIVKGGADNSYGIEVSKLAGIPDKIIKRAFDIQHTFKNEGQYNPKSKISNNRNDDSFDNLQTSLMTSSPAEKALKSLDIDTLSPIEALNALYEIKKLVNN